MFKNIVLIALLSMGSAHVYGASTIETVKEHRGIARWMGTIIPCVLSLVSAEVAIRSNKDNPDRQEVVVGARIMRLLSLVFGAFFIDEWYKHEFKPWSLGKS
jgi:hypothetical protein